MPPPPARSRLLCALYLRPPQTFDLLAGEGEGVATPAGRDSAEPAAASADGAAPPPRSARCCHLGMVVVSPNAKRHGVGRRLIECALLTARQTYGADAVDAHVVSVKPWLRAVYEKAGFARVGRAEWPAALRPLLLPAYSDMHFDVMFRALD